jgi:hypothetical protein
MKIEGRILEYGKIYLYNNVAWRIPGEERRKEEK